MLSYYQILQVKDSATDVEIKQAYRGLVKILHPDLNDNTTEATAFFRLLNEAYETLSDPLKRKTYDRKPSLTDDEETRIESYQKQNQKQGRKLDEYEELLKDYKETVYLKSKREKELIDEINDLKERNLKIEKEVSEKIKVKEVVHETQEEVTPKMQPGFSWPLIILIIVGVNLGMFLSCLAIGKAFGFLFW